MLKGLILKDIYNVRFQIIGGIFIMLYPNILMWFSAEDMEIQQAFLGIPGFFGVLVYGMLNYMSITVCSSFMLNTISDDYRTGWAKIQRTMPLSAEQIVGAKMLAVVIVIGILTAISLVCNIIGAIILEIRIEPLITMPFVMALFQMITLSVAVVLGYKSKARLIVPVYILMVFAIAAVIIALVYGVANGVVSVTMLRVIAYAIVPVIMAATVIICRKASRKAVEGDI
ncbi:MAG: ABC-2 transporter permease [Oscillospiraceae bacterium]|nr:ABC-2 transporter permease [Oscillospiraceae bacterium]